MRTKIALPFEKINVLLKGVENSPYDEQLFSLAVFAKTAGADSRTFTEDNIQYTQFEVQKDLLPFDIAKLVVSKGGKVENLPLFIEVDSLDEVIPVGIPNSIKVDPDTEEESQKTWGEWLSANHTYTEIDSKFYFGTNASNSQDLELSTLLPILNKLITQKEFIEKNSVNNENSI